MSEKEYCEIMDSNTADMKHLIDELIDRIGVVNHLEVELPLSSLHNVLKALDRSYGEGFRFSLNMYTTHIKLIIYNRD